MILIEKSGVINGTKAKEAICYKDKERALKAMKAMIDDFADAGLGAEVSKEQEGSIHVWDEDMNDFMVSMYESEPYDIASYIVSHSYAYSEEDEVYLEVLHDYMRMELSIYVYVPDYPEVKDHILTMSIEDEDISDQAALAMVSPDLPNIVSSILGTCQEEDEDDEEDAEDSPASPVK